jgi:class 3 adenylate cyclase
MRVLPSGTVTFLFTDIEGSTRLLSELGDAYADALADHREALRDAFSAHGGVEVDTQGDAFFRRGHCRSSSTLAQKRICRFHRVDRVSPLTSRKRPLTQPRGTAPSWITPGAGSMDPPKTHEQGSRAREEETRAATTSRAAIAASMTNNREKSNAAGFD